jgi:hypothetical protein
LTEEDLDNLLLKAALRTAKVSCSVSNAYEILRSLEPASSPTAWEKMAREPIGPIYGPEDLIGGWVSKRKRKASLSVLPPAKRPAPGFEVSDADDEDDESQQIEEGEEALPTGSPDTSPSADNTLVDKTPDPIASSTEDVEASAPDLEPTVIPSSQDSSGSDNQTQNTKVDKDARAALHQIEIATSIQVSHKHRTAMIDQSLALGGRDALEDFRQACSYWREEYVMNASQGGLAAAIRGDTRHPALDRFARAYHTAKNTTLRRAALNILHRINLAHLYSVYLEALEALSHFALQPKASGSAVSCRARNIFDEDACDIAKDQMFWACYPDHRGKPRSSVAGLDRTFRAMLTHAEKWHTLQEEFSIGLLALVPPGGNTWFEKLPLKDLPVYFYLVRTVNPTAISMGEMISDRVSSSWKGEATPALLLRLEHLETIDEIPFRANPLKLLEEVNVGCMGRAVTVPGDDAAALDAAFASDSRLSQRGNEYQLPPGFFDGIEFSGGNAA